MRLVRADGNKIVSDQVILARSFLKRTLGLIVGPPLTGSQCLFIPECNSIHTVGMRYGIDAVFIDRGGKIVKIYHRLKPFRFTPFIKSARAVIEFRGGQVAGYKLSEGQVLDIE